MIFFVVFKRSNSVTLCDLVEKVVKPQNIKKTSRKCQLSVNVNGCFECSVSNDECRRMCKYVKDFKKRVYTDHGNFLTK